MCMCDTCATVYACVRVRACMSCNFLLFSSNLQYAMPGRGRIDAKFIRQIKYPDTIIIGIKNKDIRCVKGYSIRVCNACAVYQYALCMHCVFSVYALGMHCALCVSSVNKVVDRDLARLDDLTSQPPEAFLL